MALRAASMHIRLARDGNFYAQRFHLTGTIRWRPPFLVLSVATQVKTRRRGMSLMISLPPSIMNRSGMPLPCFPVANLRPHSHSLQGRDSRYSGKNTHWFLQFNKTKCGRYDQGVMSALLTAKQVSPTLTTSCRNTLIFCLPSSRMFSHK